MTNVNWDFVVGREGMRYRGYVPDADFSNSGVTISTGFDLGKKNEYDIRGLSADLQSKLSPYLGLKGDKAKDVARSLRITRAEALEISNWEKEEKGRLVAKQWEQDTGQSFASLPDCKATPIMSLAFQYGHDFKTKAPKFAKFVHNDDWVSAEAELRNFGDRYSSRRKLEANYFAERCSDQPQKEDGGFFPNFLDGVLNVFRGYLAEAPTEESKGKELG